MSTPYIGFGNDQLKGQPSYTLDDVGQLVTCPNCGKKHPLSLGRDSETKKLTTALAFVRCGSRTFLAGVAGKFVGGVEPACSGTVDLTDHPPAGSGGSDD